MCGQQPKLLCQTCYKTALPPLPPDGPPAVTSYEDIGQELIKRLKFEGDQEAGRLCAQYMAEHAQAQNYDIVVAATTTPARRRQRGYDQAELLAREVARRLRVPYVRALVRVKNVHQIGMDKATRAMQARGLYVAVKTGQLSGARVLLIDDVVTTGATLASAKNTLLEAGAQSVETLAFARDL